MLAEWPGWLQHCHDVYLETGVCSASLFMNTQPTSHILLVFHPSLHALHVTRCSLNGACIPALMGQFTVLAQRPPPSHRTPPLHGPCRPPPCACMVQQVAGSPPCFMSSIMGRERQLALCTHPPRHPTTCFRACHLRLISIVVILYCTELFFCLTRTPLVLAGHYPRFLQCSRWLDSHPPPFELHHGQGAAPTGDKATLAALVPAGHHPSLSQFSAVLHCTALINCSHAP